MADDARTCRQWAEEGLGLALVPESVLRESRRLTVGILKEEALTSQLVLASRKGNLEGPAKLFFEL